jgi:hypothetical protein
VLAAIELVEGYLTPHAERVFEEAGQGGSERQAVKDAELLARWVAAQEEPPTLERAAKFCPRRLRKKPRREAALAFLEERGWLRTEKRGEVTVLAVNPALCKEA